MKKQHRILFTRLFGEMPEIRDIQQRRQSRFLSALLLTIVVVGGISAVIQLLLTPGFLPTFIFIMSAAIILSTAFVLGRTKYYPVAAIITSLTPFVVSYAALLSNTSDQSAFAFMLLSVLLSSILLNKRLSIGMAVLNIMAILVLPLIQPGWTSGVVSGKVSYHLLISTLIIISMWHRDLVEKDRQRELKESELKFRSIFDNSVDAIGVSRDGLHIMVNPAYVRMFGCESAESLAGSSILELIAPPERVKIQEYDSRRAAGEDVPGVYETRGLRRDGTEFDLEVNVSTYELNGKLYTVPILRDITDHKRSQEALRASETRYRAIVEGTTDLICRFLPDTTLTYVNESYCRYFGQSRDQLVGTRFLTLIPETDWADVLEHVVAVVRNREPVTYSHEVITPQGEIRWQQWTDSTILNEEGDVIELQSVGRDITEHKQIEDALKDSQRRLSTAMQATKIGVWEWDMRTNKAYWSDENYRVLGLEPGSVDPKYENWAKCLHPDDLPAAEAKISQAMTSRREMNIEFRVIRPDGGIHWINDIGSVLVDELGDPLGMYGIQMDITERKRAEEERERLIQELETRNIETETLRESASTVALSLDLRETASRILDQLQRVVPYDSAAVHLLAGTELEIIGGRGFPEGKDPTGMRFILDENDPAYPILKDELPYILYPEVQSASERFKEFFHSHIHSWMAVPLYARGKLIGMLTVDGFTVNKFTDAHARFTLTFANQVAVTLENSRLYTKLQSELLERERAENELRQREAILEAVAASAEMLLKAAEWETVINTILEMLGRTIHASHAYIFENRLAEDGSIRMSMRHEWTSPGFLSDLGNPKYIDMPLDVDSLESWNNTILRGLPYIGDLEHHSPTDMDSLQRRGIHALLDVPIFIDGKWWGTIGFDEMSNPRKWSTAEVDALVVAANLVGAAVKRRQMDSILRDELQKRKMLIEELENKNAELERFTYTVSHDLRSPLVTIRGFLGYLERHMRDGNADAFRADVGRISKATLQMDSLLKDLLELSRIGRLVNRPQDVPFGELVRDALEIVRGRLESCGVTLQTQPGLPIVHVDRARLTEVLQNLFDNAAKYMGDQKEPMIEVGCDGYDASNHPVFFVRDNGMGIAPEYHERIFGLFDKLDASSEGTGVGLALVKRIIEFHGGRIWVQSEAGQGSTFLFTLPAGHSS